MESFTQEQKNEVEAGVAAEPTLESLLARIKRLEGEKEVLEEANELLIEENRDLEKDAHYDELTGLKRRNVFEKEVRGFFEEGTDFCLVIFDIDRFKNVNDKYGHPAGDVVIKAVADAVQSYIRETDIAVRWGGEELAVALVGADLYGGKAKADLIRDKINSMEFNDYPNPDPDNPFKVSASAGVSFSKDFDNPELMFEAADAALYKSKHEGRNRVSVSDDVV